MTSLASASGRAERSSAADAGARSGLVARGLLWLLVGILAADVALGGQQEADEHGALATLKREPFGKALLLLVAVSFAAHAVFRVLEALAGERAWFTRAWLLAKAGVYLFLAGTTARMLVGSGSTGGDTRGPTALLLSWPAGRWCLAAAGLAIVAVGVVMAVRGFQQDFSDELRLRPGPMRRVVEALGTAGLTGRGLVYALVGSFFVEAAVRFDPHQASGLDVALKTLATQRFGAGLLWLAVVALLSFALWSFLEAAYRHF